MPRHNQECKHCGRVKYIEGRGLCGFCYKQPSIRNQYQPQTTRPDIESGGECTEAELDAIIAEQRQNLPPWWGESSTDRE